MMKRVDCGSNSEASRNRLLLRAPPQAFIRTDQDNGALVDFATFKQRVG